MNNVSLRERAIMATYPLSAVQYGMLMDGLRIA